MNLAIFEIEYDNCIVSTNKNLLDINTIHQYLSKESYWALCIPIATVQKAIDNSICFGMYKNNTQVGFARVITDKATFGYLADVFIVKEYRGIGLSKWLMHEIMNHPELQGFRGWMLGTKDAHGLYEKVGYTDLVNEKRWMEKFRV